MEGQNPDNKLLVVNLPHYNHSYRLMDGGDYIYEDEIAFNEIINTFTTLMKDGYPFEKLPLSLVAKGDNTAPMSDPIENVNSFNDYVRSLGYKYPNIIAQDMEEVIIEQEEKFRDKIPFETGTVENWWNDGWGTASYDAALNKEAQLIVPAAEYYSTYSSMIGDYLYDATAYKNAYNDLLSFDEHTWGYNAYNYMLPDYTTEWDHKRSFAIRANLLGKDILNQATSYLASQIKTDGKSIIVFNSNNWEIDDVIQIKLPDYFPKYFKITSGTEEMSYTINDNSLVFIAKDIPAMSYKVFDIEQVESAQTFSNLLEANDETKTIQNNYFKVVFAEDGTISSLIDLKNGNRELVDTEAPNKFNQYNYWGEYGPYNISYHNTDKVTEAKYYTPEAKNTSIILTKTDVYVKAEVITKAKYTGYIKQTVTLYKGINKVDIENEVVRDQIISLTTKEDVLYSFPFKTSNDFDIYHDTPNGYISPTNISSDVVLGSCTDFYTVNKYVCIVDNSTGYNIIVATPDTALMQYGERRTNEWAFDYEPSKPYLYSYVQNNQWHTNFRGEQPGYAKFSYSISTTMTSDKSFDVENAVKFGYSILNKLVPQTVSDANINGILNKNGQNSIGVSQEGVNVSAFKYAESNGEGIILRLKENYGTSGKVTINLPFEVTKATLTNIIENDIMDIELINSTSFTVDIKENDFVTIRLIPKNIAVEKVSGLTAMAGQFSNIPEITISCGNQFMVSSSEVDPRYYPDNAFDNNPASEWAYGPSANDEDKWVEVEFSKPISATTLYLCDRTNETEGTVKAKAILTLSDGSEIVIDNITGLPKNGVPLVVKINEGNIVENIVKLRVYSLEHYGFTGGFSSIYLDQMFNQYLDKTIVSWDKVENASYYEIFRATNKDGEFFFLDSLTSSGADREIYYDTQTSADSINEYYYKVRAVFKGVKGDFSSETTISIVNNAENNSDFIDAKAPLDFTLYAFSNCYDRVDLYWEPSYSLKGVDYYEVYAVINGENQLIGRTISNNTICMTIKNLDPNTNYSFVVKAIGISNKTTLSNVVSVSTRANTISYAKPTVSVSSEFNSGHEAINAFDLSLNTDWASGTKGGKNEWIKIDYTLPTELNSIKLVDRQNNVDDMKEVSIEVGFENGTAKIFKNIDIYSAINKTEGFIVDFTAIESDYFMNAIDRSNVVYVKITVTDFIGNYAGFSEIEIK